MPRRPNIINDAWKRVAVGQPGSCWPFTGEVNTHGYGQMRLNGKQELVHRLIYQLATGDDPGTLLVCHTCDNPRCCNPEHLFLGTAADNAGDSVGKGRNARGEKSGAARLTADDVVAIRRLHENGASYTDIARSFGVTAENVSYICRRETWRHVA